MAQGRDEPVWRHRAGGREPRVPGARCGGGEEVSVKSLEIANIKGDFWGWYRMG